MLLQAQYRANGHSRSEVVYASVLFAHLAGGGKEFVGEEGPIEVRGRSGVDCSCWYTC